MRRVAAAAAAAVTDAPMTGDVTDTHTVAHPQPPGTVLAAVPADQRVRLSVCLSVSDT